MLFRPPFGHRLCCNPQYQAPRRRSPAAYSAQFVTIILRFKVGDQRYVY
jgi:hypothetical protein